MKSGNLLESYTHKEKQNINYSRDYKYLGSGRILYFFQLIIMIVPMSIVYLINYEKLSYFIAKCAKYFLQIFTSQEVSILKIDYLPKLGDVYYVGLEGKYPSFNMALISFIVSVIFIILFSLIKTKNKPLMIFLTMGLYIHAFSSLFFMFFCEQFAYDLVGYSELYLKHQIIVWLLIMLTYWITTSLITKMFFYRMFTFITLIITEAAFGFVRYVLYLTFLAKCSYLFMAILYFTFGFLFDFMIMVGFYALYMKRASEKFSTKAGGGLWKWS